VTLADFTSRDLIVPQLRGRDEAAVLQELSQALQREGRVPDFLPFYHAALNREFLVSSDWEAGMAFPHARLPGLKELSFALGRCDPQLNWGAKVGHSVRLIFLIAVPATESAQYLSLVSGLARLAKDGQLVEKLRTAEDAMQMFEVLQHMELRASPMRSH
jgi:mannitol/fructose-specific phosphotransferase system IIA component (Ntr-type)